MLKRIAALILVVFLCFSVGCSSKEKVDVGKEANSSKIEKPVIYYSPLTGLPGISGDKVNDRPVAVMINNISIAQPVQTGINKADIIYETEVEGGITRLMAVYQDISTVEKLGSIRSARYPYVDLALGHNAIYIHSGLDKLYCGPHIKNIQHIDVTEKNYAFRVNNGLAYEHRLYAYSSKLLEGIEKYKFDIKAGDGAKWADFTDRTTSITLPSGAVTVTVPFSNSYTTVFKYDAEKGLYTRYFRGVMRQDYYTKESVDVKNVFILQTNINYYPDGKHKQVQLQGGNGYYCVNGTYTPIKWSKGASKNAFTFTNTDGTPLKVNAGNSWVCIPDKSRTPTFEAPAAE